MRKGCAGLIQIKQCWLLVMDNAYQADSSRTRTWLLHYIIIRGGRRHGEGWQGLSGLMWNEGPTRPGGGGLVNKSTTATLEEYRTFTSYCRKSRAFHIQGLAG
jgi:hypothetical protein